MSGALDRWFRQFDAATEGLSLYRILFAGTGLVLYFPDLEWIGRLPDSFLNPPPGPLLLLRSVPSPTALQVLELLVAVSLAALLLGYRTPWASLAVTVFSVAGYGLSYSFGKIDHTFLHAASPAVLALSGWGNRWSLDALCGRGSRAQASWPLGLLAVCLGVAFFAAGFEKAWAGWLDPGTHAALGYVGRNVVLHGREALLGSTVLAADLGPLWESLDVGTVLLECGVLLAAIRLRAFRAVLIALVAFHLGIFLLMDIAFTAMPVVYAAFLPWGAIEGRLWHHLAPGGTPRGRWGHPAAIATVAGAGVATYALLEGTGGRPLVALLSVVYEDADTVASLLILGIEAAIAAVCAGVAAHRLVRPGRSAA